MIGEWSPACSQRGRIARGGRPLVNKTTCPCFSKVERIEAEKGVNVSSFLSNVPSKSMAMTFFSMRPIIGAPIKKGRKTLLP